MSYSQASINKNNAHHENIREPWMPNVMTDSSDINREQVDLGKTGYQSVPSPNFIRPPHPIVRIAQNRDRRDHPSRAQKRVRSLQDVECVLEIVIRVVGSVYLT
jgi:hypothetical protein